jgi:hypothetical protein
MSLRVVRRHAIREGVSKVAAGADQVIWRVWMSLSLICLLAAVVTASACPSGNNHGDGTTDDGGDVDDASLDRDGDVDGRDGADNDDIGSDSEADVDSDEDVGPDADADGDADADDADGDDGWDADSLLPTGCRFVTPTRDIMYGWSGRYSIDAGQFVWRWIDTSSLPTRDVLMVRNLVSGTDREVLRRTYPDVIEKPAVHGDSVVFFSQTIADDASSQEIFLVSLTGGSERPVTSNTVADGSPLAGDGHVVYRSSPDPPPPGMAGEYRYVDLSDTSEHPLADRAGRSEIAYDGHRWVAYANEESLFRFDLSDPGAGPQLLTARLLDSLGLAFDRDTGVLIAAVWVPGESDDFRLETWDVAAGTMTVLLDAPWSQVLCDVDGHVVVYEDSQAAGETWGAHNSADLRILDRDTGAMRVVMPLDTYYGVGIWERWIAFNNYGTYGDSLIICDLVAGGYMSDDLHVIPE